MPPWVYNEFKHIGVDFDNPKQVEAYESRQKIDLVSERELVGRLGIRASHKVLDYGCGTGAFAIAAGETGAAVIAVDISGAMLGFAERNAKEAGVRTIDFVRAGFLTLDTTSNSADFAVTKFALHHLPDAWKVVALRKIWTALRPGGVLYLQDIVYSFEPESYADQLERWITTAAESGSFSRADFEKHVRDEFSTYGTLMEQMLRLAGFKIHIANYYSKVQAEYTCRRPNN